MSDGLMDDLAGYSGKSSGRLLALVPPCPVCGALGYAPLLGFDRDETDDANEIVTLSCSAPDCTFRTSSYRASDDGGVEEALDLWIGEDAGRVALPFAGQIAVEVDADTLLDSFDVVDVLESWQETRSNPLTRLSSLCAVFTDAFTSMQEVAHDIALSKGWWDVSYDAAGQALPERSMGEVLMLVVSELSEAFESLRHGDPASDHVPEFSGAEEEFADVIIRLMDVASRRGYRIAPALVEKMAFNATRPHKHGKIF